MQRLKRETTEDRVFGQTGVGHEGRLRTVEMRTVHRTLKVVIDGGGSALTTGVKAEATIGFDCIIVGWKLLADVAGSVQVDIWKTPYGSYPPSVTNSITGSAVPAISSGVKASAVEADLTGWTKVVSGGDTFIFHIDSTSAITRLTLAVDLQGR